MSRVRTVVLICNVLIVQILCLHGYWQSADMFKKKLGHLRKALRRHVEFIFITAPHRISSPDVLRLYGIIPDTVDQFGWWFSEADRTFQSKQFSDVSIGLEESVKHIEAECKLHGPIDGLLAFSQGAALAGMLCLLQDQKRLNFKFDFAILVAGFISQCSMHTEYYSGQATIPTLHVIGETDSVIPKEMSEMLAAHFKDPVLVLHPGGHYVPAGEAQRKEYIKFIEERLAVGDVTTEGVSDTSVG